MSTSAKEVTHISAEQLRTMAARLSEHEYVIVDVREPDEYEAAHIPGAHLVPLLLLESGAEQLPAAEHTVFYCRSGMRSERAAHYASMRLDRRNVYNLRGGILGWGGHTLPDRPNVRVFDTAGTAAQVLMRSIELEKGAHRLYDALLERFAGTSVERVVENLLHTETAHGRRLYEALTAVSTEPVADFEELFERLDGEILEGGEPVAAALARLPDSDEVSALEVALDMELKGFDLYRTLANEPQLQETRPLLLDMAEQEKAHVRVLLNELARLAHEGAR